MENFSVLEILFVSGKSWLEFCAIKQAFHEAENYLKNFLAFCIYNEKHLVISVEIQREF